MVTTSVSEEGEEMTALWEWLAIIFFGVPLLLFALLMIGFLAYFAVFFGLDYSTE